MRENTFCVNTWDAGCIWGKLVDWVEINKIARSNANGRFVSDLRYCGNHLDYSTNKAYAVFYTEEINYIVPLH